MTSCGNSSGNDKIYGNETNNHLNEGEVYGGETPSSYTLSEYLNSGKTLILYRTQYDDEIIEKDDRVVNIIVFKDNLVSEYDSYLGGYVYAIDENGHDIRKYETYLEITVGEISKMTDDEVIAFCEQSCEADYTNIEYQFEVYTDGTGNNTDRERIIPLNDGDYILQITNTDINTTSIVYDSTFFKLPNTHWGHSNWYRFNDEYYLSLDTPDSDNVIVDP